MKQNYTDEKTGISYTLVGDYYIPNLVMPKSEDVEMGKFGRAHLRYIKEHRKILYTNLLTQGKLPRYLHEIDTQAQDMFDRLMKQYATAQGITEVLKMQDQMKWVGMMNNCKASAEEVVYQDLIYT